MNKIQAQLKTVSKSLASLSKQVDRITRQVDKFQPAKKKASARPAQSLRKAELGGTTVLNMVYGMIRRSPKGATIAALKSKTGLGARQLSNALYKLSKKNMVRAKSRGLYVKKK